MADPGHEFLSFYFGDRLYNICIQIPFKIKVGTGSLTGFFYFMGGITKYLLIYRVFMNVLLEQQIGRTFSIWTTP